MLSSILMPIAEKLDTRLVHILSDLQWTGYRLFGVTSQLKAPGLDAGEDAWDWHRPWFCFQLHYGQYDTTDRTTMLPLHFRCEKLKNALVQRAHLRPAFGKCATGLRLFSIPLRWNGRTIGNLTVGPYSRTRLPESFSKKIAARTSFDNPEHLAWCAQQLPVIDEGMEKQVLEWFSVTSAHLMARYGRLQDGAAWEESLGTAWEPLYAPVRLADDLPASIFGVFGWPFESKPSFTPKATRGNFWELLFIERGNLDIDSAGATMHLTAGQACLFPPGRDYSCVHGSQHSSGIQVTFIGQAGIFLPLTLKPLTLRARDREDLRDICEILFARPEGSRDSIARISLLHLLLSLRKGFSPPDRDLSLTGPAARDRRHYSIAAARRYMEEHVAESLSIDDIARHCGTSVSTIAHTFKEQTGISPLQYHLKLKFELARVMLRDGTNTVTTVAEKLKFSDAAHFSRTFKKMAGKSPSEYAGTAGKKRPG